MNTQYSVGLPVRNEQETVRNTILDLLHQTIPPNEIHVCVNGSSDDTSKIVQDIAKVEHSINLINSEKTGKANAWNEIVKDNKDPKVLFCDGDIRINLSAAENFLNEFESDPNLIIIGGKAFYAKPPKETLFSKYCVRDVNTSYQQEWISGALYMTQINKLKKISCQKDLEIIPSHIINDDTFLDMITKDYNKVIDSAYFFALPISTLHDWNAQSKRFIAARQQLQNEYPKYYQDVKSQKQNLGIYIKKFIEIDGFCKKVGITSFFLFRKAMSLYYKNIGKIEYNTQWVETRSTKQSLEQLTFNNL